jgi:hypothetical protein
MGCVKNITATKFPKQGAYKDRRTRVLFHYGGVEVLGTVVRDDREEPWVTIIRLDDGRHVLATECQYAPDLSDAVGSPRDAKERP